ncbi:MAG: nucleoside-diphosphate kinase [Candidatus Babeliales bacterium]
MNKLFITITTLVIVISISIKVSTVFLKQNNFTLTIIKPDAVQVKNDEKIINMIQEHGFKILRMEKLQLTQKEAEAFYTIHKNKPFFNQLITFMISGPIIVMALKKRNAIQEWRKLMGTTNPVKAEKGTIRQLFGSTITKNAVHGSDAWQAAQQEIDQFFPGLLTNQKKTTNNMKGNLA